MPRSRRASAAQRQAEAYTHPIDHPSRPDVGVQPEFERTQPKKPPTTYRYDKSLDPQLSWDTNADRERGEALLAQVIESTDLAERPETTQQERQGALVRARTAARELASMSRPFLDWAGKAEEADLQVATLPLYVHERLSTRAVLNSVRGMKRTKFQARSLFGDPQLDIADRVGAYEHPGPWTNRMILGDSLLVMNSLLQYEGLGGKVQMIYVDPPYGVKFGSNFQPFIRKREVKHGDDADLSREPEMVQAYRDTWELGLHSYLTYLRDRLAVARELLHPTGSIFVQISDENLHHVREVLGEVFGTNNAVGIITFAKTSGATSELMPAVTDYLLWYAKDRERVKYRQLYLEKTPGAGGGSAYTRVELPDGRRRPMTAAEQANPVDLPSGSRIYRLDNLTSQSMGREKGEGAASWFPVELAGNTYRPTMQSRWKTNEAGMERLQAAQRLEATGGGGLYYVRYVDDFPVFPLNNNWSDTGIAGFASNKLYVVETNTKVVQRCLLMTTDPGDLVLDPTCGSGTTGYVAEQWGRRWITIDASRVPLALARQRLLTATFPWYELTDPMRGPAGGFVYKRRQDSRGREVGGIVPHITLKSIAQGGDGSNESAAEEVLVDRPETSDDMVRVAGMFTVEAVIPPALEAQAEPETGSTTEDGAVYGAGDGHARILEALRRSPLLRLPGGETVALRGVREPARALALHAEADAGEDGASQLVGFAFGPEDAPVTEAQVWEAAREAHVRGYGRLFMIGYAIEDSAAKLVHNPRPVLPLPVSYVQATMDLQMGDLLKTTRASQVFAVVGAPEVRLLRLKASRDGAALYRVELLGVDTFDPVSMEAKHLAGNDVPAWMLDTEYDDLVFRASQVFFPRTQAWDKLSHDLRGVYDDQVWAHLAGNVSEPFTTEATGRVAVKVIDDRGNELLVTRSIADAEPER